MYLGRNQGRAALAPVALCVLASSTAYAQVASRINGDIRDSSGAVISGAKVTLTDVVHGATQTAIANQAGRYAFPDLGVSTYNVSAEAPGFKTATVMAIKLDVNQALDVDITLEVGQVNEQVRITAAAPLLQTADTQIAGTIENKQLVDLPLAARDFMQVPGWQAGVVETRLQPCSGCATYRRQTERAAWEGAYSVNGHNPIYNDVLFDGITAKERQGGSNSMALSIDAIQELKVLSSNYSAEFGSEAGGFFSVVTKTGTNQWHGSVFEFLRNTDLNARNAFANAIPQYNRNQFGATIGAPVRRDKTFFFLSWEGIRLRQGSTLNTTVPNQTYRNGDLSALLRTDASNPRSVAIYDWTSGTPFPNNVLPAARISPMISKFIGQYIPLPNQAGVGGIQPASNYQSLAPRKDDTDQGFLRLDHVFSEKDRIFGHYAKSDNDNIPALAWPTFAYDMFMKAHHAVAGWTHVLNSNRVFDLHFGYDRYVQNEVNESQFQMDVPKLIGLAGACEDPQCWHVPSFAATGYSAFAQPQQVSGPRGWKSETFELQTSLSILKGNHSVKFGFTGNRMRDTFWEVIMPAGSWTFTGQWTAGSGSSGYALADLLLGLPRTIQASIDEFDPNLRYSQAMPWIQDDWKISRRITLNFGLRYEWLGRPYSNRDKIANFYQSGPAAAAIITPKDTGSPLAQVRPNFLPRSLVHDDYNNLAPRAGIAWQVAKKTVLRSAYGIFYQRDGTNDWVLMADIPPFIRTGLVTLSANQSSFTQFPVNDLSPVVNFVTPGSRPNLTSVHNIDWKDGLVQQWNVFLEHSLGESMVFKAGYVGNKGVGIPRYRYPNDPQPGPGDVQSRRTFQNLGSIIMRSSDGQSTYQGLELQAEKRFSQGLSFIAAYTWSKALDDFTILDLWFGGNNKGPSVFDLEHRFTYSGTWEVPFGKGRHFGASSAAWKDAVLGGWQLSGVLVLHTGFPLTVTTPGDTANAGGNIVQVPNRIAPAILPRSQETLNRFFNTAAFTQQAQYTLGNAGVGSIYGPGYRNLDLSFGKVFRVTERRSLQFRSEFFNAANHPNWGLPGVSFGTSSFGKITSTTGDARTLQFGLKFLF
jgi:hypothetical protein